MISIFLQKQRLQTYEKLLFNEYSWSLWSPTFKEILNYKDARNSGACTCTLSEKEQTLYGESFGKKRGPNSPKITTLLYVIDKKYTIYACIINVCDKGKNRRERDLIKKLLQHEKINYCDNFYIVIFINGWIYMYI